MYLIIENFSSNSRDIWGVPVYDGSDVSVFMMELLTPLVFNNISFIIYIYRFSIMKEI